MFRTSWTFACMFTTYTSMRLIMAPELGTGKDSIALSYWSTKYCDRKKWRLAS